MATYIHANRKKKLEDEGGRERRNVTLVLCYDYTAAIDLCVNTNGLFEMLCWYTSY